jgi:outer membrane biosynthesis protein TonB
MIEIYNPNPWLTWGGMGSKKLEGPNIEYIANNDSHPGAQFNSDFRNLAKTEIAKFTAQDRLEKDRVETAQAAVPEPLAYAQPASSVSLADEPPAQQPGEVAGRGPRQTAQAAMPKLPKPAKPDAKPEAKTEAKPEAKPEIKPEAGPEHVAQARPKPEPKENESRELAALLDTLSKSANSGSLSGDQDLSSKQGLSGKQDRFSKQDLSSKRELTLAAMTDYARRTYGASHKADKFDGKQPAGDDVIAEAIANSDRGALAGK